MSVSEKINGAVGTFIGSDTRISGDIQFVGNILLDGYLEGNVKAEGNDSKLTISERGHVKGSIVVPHLLVNGTIEGEVCVTERPILVLCGPSYSRACRLRGFLACPTTPGDRSKIRL